MILSGEEIREQMGKSISIDPFFEERINPNSYNLSLHDELYVYEDATLDMKRAHSLSKITIPPEGYELSADTLYLGRTVEYTKTHGFVPMLEGRSSIGRLGLFVHVTAGFGDVGFEGFWTLEMHCIQPVRIYPFVEICQIFYHKIAGKYFSYVSKKYHKNKGIQASMLYQEFQ